LDENETEQTVDPANYRLNLSGILPNIVPTTGNNWPATWGSTDAVRVTYTAGFGETQSEVPPALREAVLLRAGTRFVMTEEAGLGASLWQLGDDVAVHSLLAPFRLVTTV
jgi:hypothetical protein